MKDEQFIQAMRTAVEQRGRDYRFDPRTPGFTVAGSINSQCPTYQTPDGEGACIIGYALLLVDKRACPPYGVVMGAQSALKPLGLSDLVINAASIAQIAQDSHEPWGMALDLFEWVLENKANHGLSGFVYDVYHEAKMALMGIQVKNLTTSIQKTETKIQKTVSAMEELVSSLLAKPEPVSPEPVQWATGGVSVTFGNCGAITYSGPSNFVSFDPPIPEYVYEYIAKKPVLTASAI